MIDHRHLHGLEPARDRLPDAAEAHHPDGAVAQRRLAERVAFLRPLAGAHIALGLGKFAHGAQQQAERGVGDLFGQHVRRVGDGDAVGTRPGGVHVVVADAEGRDDLEPRKTLHEGAVDPLLGAGDGDTAHARRGLGKKLLPILGLREFYQVEGTGEPFDDHRLGRPDQQDIGLFGGHRGLLHQHRDGLLDASLERRQQLRTKRAVDHPMIA